MTEEEATEAIQQCLDRAQELGLRGIMILSPTCDECGMMHDFYVISDLDNKETLLHLLDYQRSRIAAEPELPRIKRDHHRGELQ